jgi:DNA processing protein
MSQHSVQILTGARLPHLVSDLPQPPSVLYLVGELPRGPRIAVVGTRRPTEEAVEFTSSLVSALAQAGYSIWSGGAEGIDVAAHRAALLNGAKTVVVAPAGWERPYPETHAELYQEVVDSGGAYLSLVAAEQSAQRHHFFPRNALLVALTQAVVVVQAGFRSGARNAAKTARILGRPVFAVPSCPWVHQGVGCNLEIELGAYAIGSAKGIPRQLAAVLGWSIAATNLAPDDASPREKGADRALECGAALGVSTRGDTQARERECRRRVAQSAPVRTDLDTDLNTLLVAVSQGAKSVEALCQLTGWPAAIVQSGVLRLTLQGRIRMGRSGSIEIVSA